MSLEDIARRGEGLDNDDAWLFLEKPQKKPSNSAEPLQEKTNTTAETAEAVTAEEEEYGDIDSGEQEGELDHQTATLERQLLYYKIKPKERREMLNSLPEKNRERVRFVEQYINVIDGCPSTGRTITMREAFSLYEDYQSRMADVDPDDRPRTKVGVLCEMEDMLEEKKKAAEESGDTELARRCEYLLSMVCDQETQASINEYYTLVEEARTRGSRLELTSYVKDIIENEGYCGTADMREHEPPILGGVLRLERNMKYMDMLNADDSGSLHDVLKETLHSMDVDEMTGDDWRFLEKFTEQGKALHDYVNALERAERARDNRDDYKKRYEERKEIAELLRTDTPSEELPEPIMEMLLAERPNAFQIANRFYSAEANRRALAQKLRDGSELDSYTQGQLEKLNISREEYADQCEAAADELHEKGTRAEKGEFTDEQKEIMKELMITRGELAERHEATGLALYDTARKANKEFQAIKRMIRMPGYFVNEVLCVGREGAPDIPQDVQEYLLRDYEYDTGVLALSSPDYGTSTFPATRLANLCRKLKSNQESLEKRAKWFDRTYGDGTLDMNTMIYSSESTNSYRKEADFISTKVLPALESMVVYLGGELPYRKETEEVVADAGDKPDEAELPAAA